MQRLWSTHHVFSDPITFSLRSWRSYRVRSAIRHVRMKHYPNTCLFVLNNFAYFTISISGHNVAMVGKSKPGPKGKERKRKIPTQKPPQKLTNEDADVESEGESASIANTSESPDISMETCSQPNNKKAKVITNLNLNSCFGRNLSPGLLQWSSLQIRSVKCEANIVPSGSKIVQRLRRLKYDPVIIEWTIGLVLGPTTALYRSFLKRCTLTNKAFGTIWLV